MKVKKMQEDNYMAQRAKIKEFNDSLTGRLLGGLAGIAYEVGEFLYGNRRRIVAGTVLPGAALGGLACDDNGGGPYAPTVVATATPDTGAQPLPVLIDASGSTPGSGSIDEMWIDWTGDGPTADDHFESPTDLQATHDYPAGNHTAIVTLVGSDGEEGSAVVPVDVYFGPDRDAAVQYIGAQLTSMGYNCPQDAGSQYFEQGFQIPDMRTDPPGPPLGTYPGVIGDVSGKIMRVIYNVPGAGELTAEDLAVIAAFNAEMAATLPDPTRMSVTVINSDTLPDVINALLDGNDPSQW